jgi:hypothetical protein
MVGFLKLSALQKKIMIGGYLLSFPLGLFVYGAGFREIVVALAGLELLLAMAVSESKGELTLILITMLASGISEMVNVVVGNWSYTPNGGFVNQQQILMITYVWGVFMWTAYNLAKFTMNRKNLHFEVAGVIILLVILALTQPQFYFDSNLIIVFVVGLVPWYFFYNISNKLEQAFLLHVTFLGFYNEILGILSGVWFWESAAGTNILTLVGASIGYALPLWLLLKLGWLVGNAKIKY